MTRKKTLGFGVGIAAVVCGILYFRPTPTLPQPPTPEKRLVYRPRIPFDTSGFTNMQACLEPWKDPTSLEEIRAAFVGLGHRTIARIDEDLVRNNYSADQQVQIQLFKAAMNLYEGEAREAYKTLVQARSDVESSPLLAEQWLYTVVFVQGVASLRRGEDENCLKCLGEGACIFPLSPLAVHKNPDGSQQAILHFMEYLEQFPDDLEVHWLLNLAHMTLGKYPRGVSSKHLLNFPDFGSECDIGRFHDIGHLAGVNRFNQAGGAVMDDFDNDGLLDIVVSSMDPLQSLAFYHNKGDGTFEERTEAAGLQKQYGGLNLVQTDYNNDGYLDLFVSRGAWFRQPMRPSLLRNNGNGTFTDVTREAGLMNPANSICGTWADFDNDGHLDLFVCCETGPNRLYHNRGNGTFEEVAAKAGLQGKQQNCKGAVWLDYDNDGYPDLFVTYLRSTPQLFHNNRDGTFTDVTAEMGITGPRVGFSCWAFDYDNDGWLDIFATCYEHTLEDVIEGMRGRPSREGMDVTRLYRNRGGKKFEDVSKETGVDKVFATMGCNFGDFDNDGYLDFYLGTGDPYLHLLVPNRMFKNVRGKRFAEMTATSGTGHLQKGHGVACGDWDRDGNVDLFVQMGGPIPGDRFHNALFQNPGQGNHWLTLKLIGKKTNRAAIGARIKVLTTGENPLIVHRHVGSGSSFGGNPLQQTIGLGKAKAVATLEIFWPTSQTTQVFRNVAVNQAIEVMEFAKDYQKLDWPRIPQPKD
jgi:FG-GAP-like repeat/ASPIC and UnbV